MNRTRLRNRMFAGPAVLALSLIVAACGGSGVAQGITTINGSGTVVTGTVPLGTGTAAADATVPAVTATVTETVTPEASGTGTANISVSPANITLGSAVLAMAIAPAQPMLDPSRQPSTPTSGASGTATTQGKGYVVLGGSTLKVTNNFDTSQSAPADQANAIVRHLGLQVKDSASGQLIPNLVLTVDILRDGRPVLQDQPLVAMVPVGGTIQQMEYGNNVKFPGNGDYQIFVRTDASPLLATGSSGSPQFNVTVK